MAARIYYKVIFNTFTDWKVHLRCPETTHVSITPPLPRQLLILVEKMINIKVVFTNDRKGFFFLNKMTAPPPPQYTMGMLVGGKIILWSIQDSNSFCHISLCARAQRQCQHCAITVLDAFMWPVHPTACFGRQPWRPGLIDWNIVSPWQPSSLALSRHQNADTSACELIFCDSFAFDLVQLIWRQKKWGLSVTVPCSQGWYTVRINHCSQF